MIPPYKHWQYTLADTACQGDECPIDNVVYAAIIVVVACGKGETMKERPEFVTDEHLEYLDDLRESGETNMFGAAPYLEEWFDDLDRHDARTALSYWMETFPREE